jgi:hypothetical protein
MHHDFAAGGIIAFAGGGEADPGAYPEQTTLEQERAERLKNQELYGFGGDPYAEAKRRYSDLEKRQLEREKNAGADRFWAGLSTFAGSGTRGFGESMGMALKTAQDLEEKQKAEGDTQRAKMAELSALWGKEQDALNRANYAADKGRMDEKRKALMEAANYRLEREKVEATKTSAGAAVTSAGASVTSANASAQNAKTLEEQRQFEQRMYPEKFALEQRKANAEIARAGRPDDFQQRYKLYKTDPNAFQAIYGNKLSGQQTSREEAIKNLVGRMGAAFTMLALKPEGLAQQEALIKQEMSGGAAPKPAGGVTVKAPNGQTYSFPTAQAAEEFKKKAGIQ